MSKMALNYEINVKYAYINEHTFSVTHADWFWICRRIAGLCSGSIIFIV